jgi:hypothetical protein
MSDHELAPEEQAEVSRLLAEVATPVDLPEHVAVRLDNVLAGLVAEREEPLADVVPLRRRRWPKVLVAAAAVSLFGYVGASMLQSQSADDASNATSEGAESLTPGSASADRGGESPDAAPQPSEAYGSDNGVVLDEDLAKAALEDRPLAGLSGLFAAGSRDRRALIPVAGKCASPKRLAGQRTFLVDLGNDRSAVVVLRPLGGSAAVADIYPCRETLFPIASMLVLAAR